MKTERTFPKITVTKKAETSLRAGHPWVYDAEITDISSDGPIENGAFADVVSQKGSYLGTGFYSEKSKIRVRILAQNANETFGEAFFERRLRYAVDYRKTVMQEDFSNCRLIFGEADGLPGLTVDRFSNILVAQVLSYGMDVHLTSARGSPLSMQAYRFLPLKSLSRFARSLIFTPILSLRARLKTDRQRCSSE